MIPRRLLATLAFLAPTAALAQSLPSPGGAWTVTLKGNVVAAPAYPGADDLRVLPYPSFSIRRAGTPARFGAPDDSVSFGLLDLGWLRAGPSFNFIGARKASDHPELYGLRNVDWTLEAGVFAEVWPTEFMRARLDVRRGFHGHHGVVADIGADGVLPYGAWTFSAGPRLSVATQSFMDAYFSVTPGEALANGVLPAYSAGGGLKSVGLAGAATYRFSPQWAATAFARYDRLVADAGDSPIPQQFGSRNQFRFGATVAYSFDITM